MSFQEYEPVEGYKWLYRRMPSGVHYICRKQNGKMTRSSLRTADESVAIELYVETLGKPVAPRRDIYVGQAWKEFIENEHGTLCLEPESVKRYRSAWKTWCADLLEGMRVADVEPAHVNRVIQRAEEGISKKTKKPLSPSSKLRVKDAMSAFFKSCTKEPTRYRLDNPCSFVAPRNYRDEVAPLDEEQIVRWPEVDMIANAFGDYARVAVLKRRTIVQLMPRTGCRINEMLALTTNSIKDGEDRHGPYGSLLLDRQVNSILDRRGLDAYDDSRWFKPLKGKLGEVGSQKRMVHLSQEARQLLDTYLELALREGWAQKGGLLFPNENGMPFASTALGTEISDAAEAAGIERRIRSHYFRHTYATNLFTKGATAVEVATLLGNSEDVVRKVYVHFVDRAAFAERIARLSA